MTDVEQADRFEKATTFDGEPEDPQDKMVQDAAKKNSRAGGRDDTKTYDDAAKNISEQAQKNVSGVIKPETVQGREAKGLEGIGLTNRENANKQFDRSGSIVKPPKAPKAKAPETKPEGETAAPGPQGMTNPEFDPEQVEKFKEANKTPAQLDAEAAEKRRDPSSYDPGKVVEAARDKDRAPGEQTEQPQGEQQPQEELPVDAKSAQDTYLEAISTDEWDAAKKIFGDIGVAGMDATANLGEALERQYGALAALVGTALRNPASMSTASQALTSTATGLAAMNSFVDKTAQRSLGVKPGVSPERLKDQLAVKGAGWYIDRDRAAAAEKYVTTRLDQTVKDILNGRDVTDLTTEDMTNIQEEMDRWLTPIYREIISRPPEQHSMTDKAYINAYNAMNRGVGKMSKQANSNARMVMKQFNQQAKEQSQQVKDLKAQANDRDVWWNSYQKDPQNGLPPEIQKKMYNSFEQDRRMGRKLTPEQEGFMEDYDSNRYDFQKRNATIAWMGRNSNEYVLNVMRKRHNDALNAIKAAIGRYRQSPQAGFQLDNAEKRAIQNYSSLIEAYHKGGYDRKYPLDEEDKALSELFDEYLALDDPQILENIEKIAERPVKKSAVSVNKPLNAPIQTEKPQNTPIETKELPKGEQNVLEEPKTIESPVNPAADPSPQIDETLNNDAGTGSGDENADETEPDQSDSAGYSKILEEMDRDLFREPQYYGRSRNGELLKDGFDEFGIPKKESAKVPSKYIAQINHLLNHAGDVDTAIEFLSKQPNRTPEMEEMLKRLNAEKIRIRAYLDKDKPNNIYAQLNSARKKLLANKDKVLKMNRATDRDKYISNQSKEYGRLDGEADEREKLFGENWDNIWKDEDRRLADELAGRKDEEKKKQDALTEALRNGLRDDGVLIRSKLSMGAGTLANVFKDTGSKKRALDYLFGSKLPDGSFKPGVLSEKNIQAHPEYSELTPERIGNLYDRWANGDFEEKKNKDSPAGDEEQSGDKPPAATRYDDPQQLQKVIHAMSRGSLGKNKKIYKTKRGGLEYLQGLMNQPFEGNRTLSELYDESIKGGKPDSDAFINQIKPGKNGASGHPVYRTLSSKDDVLLKKLYDTWTMLHEKFSDEFQSPVPEDSTKNSDMGPTGEFIDQGTDDSPAPPSDKISDEDYEKWMDRVEKWNGNVDDFTDEDALAFRRLFDARDGESTLFDNIYGEMDDETVDSYLKKIMSRVGDKYAGDTGRVQNAINKLMGMYHPENSSQLVWPENFKRAMPSIEDLMDSGFTL